MVRSKGVTISVKVPINWEAMTERTKQRLRSEEHTSELQSRGLISYAVFCLKKKKTTTKKKKKKNYVFMKREE